jgi:hypothetical protein
MHPTPTETELQLYQALKLISHLFADRRKKRSPSTSKRLQDMDKAFASFESKYDAKYLIGSVKVYYREEKTPCTPTQ